MSLSNDHDKQSNERGLSAAANTQQPSQQDPSTEECERLMDEELKGTFPASDPPSWTMGGSHVSTLRQ